MQEYKKTVIEKDQIVPIAEKMKKDGIFLLMIHGYVDKEGQIVVTYDYQADPVVDSYHVIGEWKLPSIGGIYETAATWPEREINELYGVEFEGLDMSQRLFLPEDLLETQGKGQIMVMPLSELVEKNKKEATR